MAIGISRRRNFPKAKFFWGRENHQENFSHRYFTFHRFSTDQRILKDIYYMLLKYYTQYIKNFF